jgi:hypothetical protein
MLLAGAVGVVAYRISNRKERARRARWDGWVRVVLHPEDISPKPRGFFLGVLGKCASVAAAATLAAVAKHFATNLLRGQPLPNSVRLRLPPAADPFPPSAATR